MNEPTKGFPSQSETVKLQWRFSSNKLYLQLSSLVPSVFSQSGLLATYSFLTWVASFWDRFCAESKCCKVCATCAATPTASQNANGVVQLALWLVEHLWRSMHFCMFIPALPTHYSKTVLYVQKVRVLCTPIVSLIEFEFWRLKWGWLFHEIS